MNGKAVSATTERTTPVMCYECPIRMIACSLKSSHKKECKLEQGCFYSEGTFVYNILLDEINLFRTFT